LIGRIAPTMEGVVIRAIACPGTELRAAKAWQH
jgi:hypothetical protein